MKKIYKMLILLLIAAALAGLYAVIKNADSNEENTVVYINRFSTENVSQISWNNGTENLLFKKSGDSWTYPENTGVTPDSEKINGIVGKIEALTASDEIQNVTDFEQYGLEDPYVVIEVTMSDGNSVKYTVGDYSTFTHQTYIRVGNGTSVFLIDPGFTDDFDLPLKDLEQNAD